MPIFQIKNRYLRCSVNVWMYLVDRINSFTDDKFAYRLHWNVLNVIAVIQLHEFILGWTFLAAVACTFIVLTQIHLLNVQMYWISYKLFNWRRVQVELIAFVQVMPLASFCRTRH